MRPENQRETLVCLTSKNHRMPLSDKHADTILKILTPLCDETIPKAKDLEDET